MSVLKYYNLSGHEQAPEENDEDGVDVEVKSRPGVIKLASGNKTPKEGFRKNLDDLEDIITEKK